MPRLVVIGTSGAGKTRAAQEIGRRLGVAVVELDSMYHRPGWESRPADEFRALVDGATAGDDWVVDGNYSVIRDIVWPRAQHVIWLDYSRPVVMRRVVRRTVRRVLSREMLWGVVSEPWSNLLSADPQRSIIAWAWSTHHDRRRRYAALVDDPEFRHLQWTVVGHPRLLATVIDRLAGGLS